MAPKKEEAPPPPAEDEGLYGAFISIAVDRTSILLVKRAIKK